MGEHKNIRQKVLAVQASMGPIPRNRIGQVGSHRYKYADLADVMSAISGPLEEQGLVLTSQITVDPEKGMMTLHTTLYDVDSDDRWGTQALIGDLSNGPQRLGSNITYLRRYLISSLLNLVVEDDLDGANGSATKPLPPQSAPKAPPSPPEDGSDSVAEDYYHGDVPQFRWGKCKDNPVPISALSGGYLRWWVENGKNEKVVALCEDEIRRREEFASSTRTPKDDEDDIPF